MFSNTCTLLKGISYCESERERLHESVPIVNKVQNEKRKAPYNNCNSSCTCIFISSIYEILFKFHIKKSCLLTRLGESFLMALMFPERTVCY